MKDLFVRGAFASLEFCDLLYYQMPQALQRNR